MNTVLSSSSIAIPSPGTSFSGTTMWDLGSLSAGSARMCGSCEIAFVVMLNNQNFNQLSLQILTVISDVFFRWSSTTNLSQHLRAVPKTHQENHTISRFHNYTTQGHELTQVGSRVPLSAVLSLLSHSGSSVSLSPDQHLTLISLARTQDFLQVSDTPLPGEHLGISTPSSNNLLAGCLTAHPCCSAIFCLVSRVCLLSRLRSICPTLIFLRDL